MHSPVPAKPCDDPCDVVAVAPDAVRVAPSDEELSDVLHQAARARSDTKTACSSGSPEGRTAPQFVVTSALPSEEVAPATAPGVPAVASLVQTAPKQRQPPTLQVPRLRSCSSRWHEISRR